MRKRVSERQVEEEAVPDNWPDSISLRPNWLRNQAPYPPQSSKNIFKLQEKVQKCLTQHYYEQNGALPKITKYIHLIMQRKALGGLRDNKRLKAKKVLHFG